MCMECIQNSPKYNYNILVLEFFLMLKIYDISKQNCSSIF